MTTALVSPKFQVVIPKEIRKTLGIRPGQRLHVSIREGRIEFEPVLSPEELIGYLKSTHPLQFERESDRAF